MVLGKKEGMIVACFLCQLSNGNATTDANRNGNHYLHYFTKHYVEYSQSDMERVYQTLATCLPQSNIHTNNKPHFTMHNFQ